MFVSCRHHFEGSARRVRDQTRFHCLVAISRFRDISVVVNVPSLKGGDRPPGPERQAFCSIKAVLHGENHFLRQVVSLLLCKEMARGTHLIQTGFRSRQDLIEFGSAALEGLRFFESFHLLQGDKVMRYPVCWMEFHKAGLAEEAAAPGIKLDATVALDPVVQSAQDPFRLCTCIGSEQEM